MGEQSNSKLWNKQKAADYLFSEMIDDPKKRLIKLNNWITRHHIPKNCMDKIGREILFFGDVLQNWIENRKEKAA